MNMEVHMTATLPVGKALLREATRGRRGMSLVEVMVVIAIIVTLMAIVGGGAIYAFNASKVSTTELQIHEVDKRVQLYSLKKGAPSTGDGLKAVYGDEKLPQDGWGHEFIYVAPGPNGMEYDILSYGSDGAEGGTGNAEDLALSKMK
jgi:general secretion pathway protein G